MMRRAMQVCVVFFRTPIPASVHVHTHARVNAHTRIHLMLNAPKRGGHVQAAGTGPKSRTKYLW